MKVVRLSALRTSRLYPPGNIPGTHFCQRLRRPQGHSAAARIKSMKNSSDTIGNRTRNRPTCSSVPQPTVPPPAPAYGIAEVNLHRFLNLGTIGRWVVSFAHRLLYWRGKGPQDALGGGKGRGLPSLSGWSLGLGRNKAPSIAGRPCCSQVIITNDPSGFDYCKNHTKPINTVQEKRRVLMRLLDTSAV
jgi:hypothetical protein